MTSLLRFPAPALAAAVCLVLAACCAAAHAAVPLTADITVSSEERWTYKPAGYPKTCIEWIYAKGTVSAVAHAQGPLIFSTGGGYTAGGLSRTATHELAVERLIDFKLHKAPTGPPCVPCGPQSELGPCAPPAGPDEGDHSSCAPEPKPVDGLVRASLATNGTLTVEASSAPSRPILLECTASQLLLPGVPLGTPEPPMRTFRFRGAARRIERLAPGASTTFRKSARSGPGCRPTKAAFQGCTTNITIMEVTRKED